MEPDVVAELLDSLLSEAVDALGTTEGAVGAPERRYVAHGAVTWDCDQLTTHLVRLTPRLVDPKGGCAIQHVCRLALVLIRCHPTVSSTGVPPSAAELDTANQQLAVDGWAMWKHLTARVTGGEWPVGRTCRNVTFSGLEPLAPSGGFAGWRIDIDVRL